ncbi:hypothetical protein FRC08_013274 [Ceratobasidium sp. 394]|nr:hypothetical protein FRC08_013274 [Ceratobasidium sp. 394]
MESAESGPEQEDSEDESEDEPTPAPVSVLKTKRPAATRPPKKVSFATKQTTAKPAAPRRVGNANPARKKSQVVNVAGEESYDFSKFF